MRDLVLDVGNAPAGIALVPEAIELLGGGPELDNKVARQVLSLGLAPFLLPETRALLRWSAAELAREAALGLATIKRAELADGETSMTMANDLAVRRAFEAAGVEFIEENGGGPGVRLRKAHQHGKRK